MARVLALHCSSWGHIEQLAHAEAKGALAGKVGAVFTSAGLQHWGQEGTILSFHHLLFRHGFIVVWVPPTTAGLHLLDEVTGGSPCGAGTIAGPGGSRQPSENGLSIARAQGAHVARIAARLAQVEAPAEDAAIAA